MKRVTRTIGIIIPIIFLASLAFSILSITGIEPQWTAFLGAWSLGLVLSLFLFPLAVLYRRPLLLAESLSITVLCALTMADHYIGGGTFLPAISPRSAAYAAIMILALTTALVIPIFKESLITNYRRKALVLFGIGVVAMAVVVISGAPRWAALLVIYSACAELLVRFKVMLLWDRYKDSVPDAYHDKH